jgi:hypothetical protein
LSPRRARQIAARVGKLLGRKSRSKCSRLQPEARFRSAAKSCLYGDILLLLRKLYISLLGH